MKHLSLLLALTVSGASLMAADVASAQDIDNLDEPQGKKKKDKKKKEQAVVASDEIVRGGFPGEPTLAATASIAVPMQCTRVRRVACY